MNITCQHCGKQLSPADFQITIHCYTVMGEKLLERYNKKPFLWAGTNESYMCCNECFPIISKLIKNENYSKIKKIRKEYNCPDCNLDISTCMGCPRYNLHRMIN